MKLNKEKFGIFKMKEHKFNSSSSNKEYTTIDYGDNTYSCNCPAWIFKKSGKERNCKHIEEVKYRKEFQEVVVQEIKKEVLEIEYRK